MPQDDEVDVIVVGAGPVGTTLSLDLARRGLRVLELDRSAETTTNPRCNTTSARSMEYFRVLGLADEIRRAGLPGGHATDVVYCTNITGHELNRFEFSSSDEVLRGTAHELRDWPTCEPQHRISQIFLEPIINRAVEANPRITLLRGWEALDTTQDRGSATVTARDLATGTIREFRAAYVVGCDGGASVVRKSIGATLLGESEAALKRVSIYLRSDELAPLFGERPGWMYWWYGERYYGTVIQLDGESRYLCHARVPRDMTPEQVDPDEVLQAAFGTTFDHEKLDVIRWTTRRLVADRLREGRIMIAGDAAHLWLPIGGFGMNAGIGDAMGLSWRLAALLDGWGGERLLDDWEAERHAVDEATSQAALTLDQDMSWVAQEAGLDEATPEAERRRREVGARIREIDRKQWFSQGVQLGSHYSGSPGVGGTGERYGGIDDIGDYEPLAEPGSRLPHYRLPDGSSVFDHLGVHFTLLRIGPDAPAADRLTDALARLNVPLAIVTIDEPDALATYRHPLVLVRPDMFVAWSGDAVPDEFQRLLSRMLDSPEPEAALAAAG